MLLYWTKKKPTQEGWYWIRKPRIYSEGPHIVYVRWYVNELCIGNWAIAEDAEWAGPIPFPTTSGCNDVDEYYKDEE